MDFTSVAESRFERLPSFLKWLSTASEKELAPARYVTTIWYPNKFPSISFETEVFVLRISEKNELYQPLLQSLPALELAENALLIQPLSRVPAEFRIKASEVESASWESLGEYGRRLTVQNRKRGRSRLT